MNDHDKSIIHPRAKPITADEIPPAWLHQVREVVVREKHKLRAGFPACIDVLSSMGTWMPLQLPSNGIEFVGRRDRDAVLDMLLGNRKLPDVPVQEVAK